MYGKKKWTRSAPIFLFSGLATLNAARESAWRTRDAWGWSAGAPLSEGCDTILTGAVGSFWWGKTKKKQKMEEERRNEKMGGVESLIFTPPHNTSGVISVGAGLQRRHGGDAEENERDESGDLDSHRFFMCRAKSKTLLPRAVYGTSLKKGRAALVCS